MSTIETLLSVLAIACVTGTATPRPPEARSSPESAVEAYFRASDNGSSTLLRLAFHPTTVMHWVDAEGVPQARSQLEWWMGLDGEPSPRPADLRKLTVLDREGPFALIEAASRWPSHRFDDYLLVVQTADGWKIAGKVFVKSPPGTEPPAAAPGDEAAIRAVIDEKIAAHAHLDPARLARTHLADASYVRIGVGGVPFQHVSLSEAAWTYAARRDAGEDGHASRWRTLAVFIRGPIAAVKLDVMVGTTRYVDHLLLLRTAAGWRIAAATWGDPGFTLAPTDGHAREIDHQESPQGSTRGQERLDGRR